MHGPVKGTVTVGGEPYAIAKDRSTRGREPAGELAFSELDSNEVHSPQQFFEAANHLETTFNMAYLDSKHIAYFSTGRLPVLAAGTDPSLPTLGTGEYDWTGLPHRRNSTRTKSTRPSEHVPELEQQAGARMGRGLGQLLLWAGPPRADVHGFDTAMTEAERRHDHEPRRHRRICGRSRSGRSSSRCWKAGLRRANWPKKRPIS